MDRCIGQVNAGEGWAVSRFSDSNGMRSLAGLLGDRDDLAGDALVFARNLDRGWYAWDGVEEGVDGIRVASGGVAGGADEDIALDKASFCGGRIWPDASDAGDEGLCAERDPEPAANQFPVFLYIMLDPADGLGGDGVGGSS